MTVVETVRFLKDAEGLLPESDRARLVEFIGANPEAGDLVPETGGVRKLRGALPGAGKRGGARVIYFFHNETLPVFLLALYGKNQKANLSKAERNAMAKLVPAIIHGYSKGRGKK
ncbi:MAG: type II toxin-antitoxin system RelE/ParE family toxin [Acidobacteriota bacterium]|nr:type II toxin-antitoxin system RelE/ParE family toxin [Acidobacteriota bacterium]